MNEEEEDPKPAPVPPDELLDADSDPENSEESPEETDSAEKPISDLLVLGIWFEGGLAVLALIIGWFGFRDSTQSLTDFDSVTRIQPAFIWALIALIPMLGLLLASLKSDFGIFKSLRKTVEEHLYPLIKDLAVWKIALLSILAGVGEELLFRWCLQGGLTEYFNFEYGPHLAALLIGILFGLCHFITSAYAILTAILGVFLGLVMIWSGTWLAPALAHAFYDFIALLVIARQARVKENIEKDQ